MHRVIFPGICTSLLAWSIYSSAKCSNQQSTHSKNTVPLSTGMVIECTLGNYVTPEKVEGRKTPISCQGRHTGPRPNLTANKSYRIVFNQTNQVPNTSMTLEGCHSRGVAESWRGTAVCPKRVAEQKSLYMRIYTYIFILFIYIYEIIILTIWPKTRKMTISSQRKRRRHL